MWNALQFFGVGAVEPHRSIHIRHAADVLANIVSTADLRLTCICSWVLQVRTAPASLDGKPFYAH